MSEMQAIFAQNANSTLFQNLQDIVWLTEHNVLGQVTAVYTDDDGYATRVDAELLVTTPDGSSINLSGVELMYIGSKSAGARYTVEKGDLVVMHAFKQFFEELAPDSTPSMPSSSVPYSYGTLKAIPIQGSANTSGRPVIVVSSDATTIQFGAKASEPKTTITVTTDGAVTVDAPDAKIAVKCKELNVNDGNLQVL